MLVGWLVGWLVGGWLVGWAVAAFFRRVGTLPRKGSAETVVPRNGRKIDTKKPKDL